jgi:hypothetical protein
MTTTETTWKTIALCSLSALAGMCFVAACGSGPRTAGADGGGECLSYGGVPDYSPSVMPCLPQLAGRTIETPNFAESEGGGEVARVRTTFDSRGRIVGVVTGNYDLDATYDDEAEVITISFYGETATLDYSGS